MTLIEVMMAIAILGIVIAPLTAAVIVYLRNTNTTMSRMSESHDAQIASAYFEYDVQNTGLRDWSTAPFTSYKTSVALGVPVNQSPYGCGTDTTASLVRFAWDDPAATVANQTIRSAIYVVKPIDANTGELHRVTCIGGVPTDITIVHNVDLANPPSVTCPNTAAECTAVTIPPAPPNTVKLTLHIKAPGQPNDYTVELLGQRRQT